MNEHQSGNAEGVQAVDRKRARLNCITHLLSQVLYEDVKHAAIALADRVYHPDHIRHLCRPT